MSTTDPPPTEDSVSIISFDNDSYLEDDYALPGSDFRIQHWLSQQCRFALDSTPPSSLFAREKGLVNAPDSQRIGPYTLGGSGELLSSVLMKHRESSTVMSVSEGGEAALRADSPLLGFGGKGVGVEGDDDERTLTDPLHFPSATYVRDLPGHFYQRHSPHSSHSSNTSSSRHSGTLTAIHARSQSTGSSRRISQTLGLSPLSRRPSLLRESSLPLLGELDDEQQASSTITSQVQPQAISQAISPPVIPQTSRSRAQSNASISSFHLPTSMQFTHTPPTSPTSIPTPVPTPISPSPIAWRHSRTPGTPPVSSTRASLSFGDVASPVRPPIPRPHSQLHHHNTTHRHHNQPPQKIPRALSRSSSTLSLSLLTNNPNNRNAVYIDDDLIDIDSGDFVDNDLVTSVVEEGGKGVVDLGVVVEGGEDDKLPVGNEEKEHHVPLISPTKSPSTGVYSNAFRSSSQVYLGSSSCSGSGSGTTAKKPTRPPPAPPLIIDGDIEGENENEKDSLGGLGVGVVDGDAILSGVGVGVGVERDQFGEDDPPRKDRDANAVYPHHPQSSRQQQQQPIESEESDIAHSDFDTELHDTDTTDLDGEGGDDDKLYMSRWSLTSSMDENLTSPTSALGVAGGGGGSGGRLFGSRNKDKEKKSRVLGEKDKDIIEKEKGDDKEKEKEKKRGRLVSFISRISSNIASPSSSPDGFDINQDLPPPPLALGLWIGDLIVPSPSVLLSSRNIVGGAGAGASTGTGGMGMGKKKDKNKKGKEKEKEKVAGKVKGVVTVVKEKEGESKRDGVTVNNEDEMKKVDDKEENEKPKANDKDSLPPLPIESIEVVPATIPVPVNVPVMLDGGGSAVPSASVDPATLINFKANRKTTLSQLRVDTSIHGGGHDRQRVPVHAQIHHIHPHPHQQLPESVSNGSGAGTSSPQILSSSHPFPSPSLSQSQSLTNGSSSKGLNHVASPIVKAFSEGLGGAGSAPDFMGVRSVSASDAMVDSRAVMVGGGESGNMMGMGMWRSSSAADLLGRSRGGSGDGYHDSYQHRQYQHHQHQHQYQQVLGQQGQGQVQGQGGQAPRYASGYLHPQPQFQRGQNPQQGYSSESGYQPYGQQCEHYEQHQQQQQQQRQRRQSQPLQYQPQSEHQSGLQQQQPQSRQPQTYSSDYYGVLGGTSSLMSPAGATADATTPCRPGLVKSVSTPMLNIGGSGGGGGDGYRYGVSLARRHADLPPTPVSPVWPATTDDGDGDKVEFRGDDKQLWRMEQEEEEEDYGVEAVYSQWRDGGGGFADDSDREREATTRDRETRSEIEHEERWDSLQRQQLQEHSTIATTTTTTTTTTIGTPRVSTEMSPSSSASPSIRTRSGSSSNITVTKIQEQMRSLVQGADQKHRSRHMNSLSNLSVIGDENGAAVAPTPTATVKTGSGSSKGFRGFVERMKFTTTTTTNSPSSSSPSPLSASPIISPMVPANIGSAASTTSFFTTSTATASNTPLSSPPTPYSPATSFIVGNSSGGGGSNGAPTLSDGSFFKKQPKRKLVINGVNEDDVKGYEAVKAWCESFGEVREMRRTPDGYLHVDFKKASVAETVCRLKTQVFIKGAGSVSLSWYTKENKGLLL